MEAGAWGVTIVLWSAVLVLSIAWALRRRHQQRLFKRYGIPGPEPSLFLGNWKQLKEDRLKVMDDWIRQYGKVFGFYEGEIPKVVVSDLDAIKECFVKETHVFHDRVPIIVDVEPVKSSLIGLKGEEWKRVRTVLSPSFSSAKMKLMWHTMSACGDTMVDVISEHLCAGRAVVNVTTLSQAFSMDVITKCALAWQVECQRNAEDPVMRRLQKILLEVDERLMATAVAIPVLRKVYAWIFSFLSYGKLFLLIMDNLRKVISVRTAEMKERPRTTVDMLQLMLDAKNEADDGARGKAEITDRHLMANCFLFLAAGFETTATALSFVLYELARHPEEQERVFEEVTAQLSENSGELGYDGVQKLRRLGMVISECLRLYPPLVLFTARVCGRDTKLGGYTVPAGAHVILPTWHVHHRPDLWPEPYRFIPDRFTPDKEQGERRHPAAYVPFGLGARECMGRRFALLEVKTVLAKLVSSYIFRVCEETDDPMELTVPAVTVNPARKIKLRVARRDV
ncbi:cytochrome P450 3A4-like isoform X2 [Amblyomma americanum]